MTRRSYESLLVPGVLYLASFALLLATAHALGVATNEPPRIRAAVDAAQLFSPAGKLVATWAARLDVALSTGRPSPFAPTIASAYLWAVLARAPHATLDGLTAARLGNVVFAAAVPPLVHALARPWLGRSLAVLAAALALLAPRALVDGATLSGDGTAVAFVLAALVLYLRSVERRSAGAGALSAAMLGLAAAASPSTLVIVPVVIVHYALERRESTRRLARRGLFPLPIAVAALPVVGLATFLLAQPHLAHDTVARVRDLVLAALSPVVSLGTWGGLPPSVEAIPRAHAAASLLIALPTTTAVLAAVGAIAAARLPQDAARDGGARVRLAAMGAIAVALGPFVAPAAMRSFPSHWALGVPFLALLAAFGAGVIARALASPTQRAFVLAVAAAAPLRACLPTPSMSAYVPTLAGLALRGGQSGRLPLHDETPLAGLTRALDEQGLSATTVFAPEISAEVWTETIRLGRLRTHVVPVSTEAAAALEIVSGDVRGHGGTVLAEVRREGHAVLTLLRR